MGGSTDWAWLQAARPAKTRAAMRRKNTFLEEKKTAAQNERFRVLYPLDSINP
jgi:hypothetical protein